MGRSKWLKYSVLVMIFALCAGTGASPFTCGVRPMEAYAQAPKAETGNFQNVFAVVAEKVRPAVVFIKTERTLANEGWQRLGPFDFFRDLIPDDPNHKIPGGGSGFVIGKEGRILTNYHVIDGADKIMVVLGDDLNEEEYEADVVGYDQHTDIAIIKINPKMELPVVKLGDSDKCRVGDWVMAIGTPFGQLAGTVTVGVVSAKGRSDLRIAGGTGPDYQNFIQTDASINFGNSGGPLVNIEGEAIGINTAINPSGQGIGFAIPINMVRNIVQQLVEKGRVQYGYIGISLQQLDKTLSEGLGMKVDKGVMVREVLPGTPAEKAGLQPKDVIVEFNGKPVKEMQKFRMMVGNTPVGSSIPIAVLRDGKRKDLTIDIVERPEDVVVAAAPGPQTESWLGIHVDAIDSPTVRENFKLSKVTEGVVVVEVDENSPASEAGLVPGDVITEVFSHKVSNMDDYRAIAEKLKTRKESIAFLVKKKGYSTYIPVIPRSN
jgi:serine protease Do